jgi:glycosyltransferase involved in cell wall biosynthesis
MGKGFEERKMVRIYDAMDLSEFKQVKSREDVWSELNIEDDRPVVSIFGNVQQWKNQETVIKACERLRTKYPDILCCIFGGIIEKEYADRLMEFVHAKEMERNVLFAGYRNDVPDCMNASDILVHASAKPEPFGMVVIEGMAMGKPVIAANIGGPPEIMEDGISGLLFEPRDYAQLAERIDYVLSHSGEASRLGENAVRRVEKNFRIEKQIELIKSVYKNLQ